MSYVKIENLLDKTKSLFKLVTLASRRALELNEGAQRLVEDEGNDPSNIALREIAEGKVSLDINEEKTVKKPKKKKKKGK